MTASSIVVAIEDIPRGSLVWFGRDESGNRVMRPVRDGESASGIAQRFVPVGTRDDDANSRPMTAAEIGDVFNQNAERFANDH